MDYQRHTLTQGERIASAAPEMEVSTLLGSCVWGPSRSEWRR